MTFITTQREEITLRVHRMSPGCFCKHVVYYFKYKTIREHSGHISLCPVRRAFASVHFLSTNGHQTMEATKSQCKQQVCKGAVKCNFKQLCKVAPSVVHRIIKGKNSFKGTIRKAISYVNLEQIPSFQYQ